MNYFYVDPLNLGGFFDTRLEVQYVSKNKIAYDKTQNRPVGDPSHPTHRHCVRRRSALMTVGYEQGQFEALAHFDGSHYKGATVMYNVAEW